MGRILLSLCLLAASAWSQTITVTSPAAEAVWKQGETKTIQWTKQGETGANVRITLRAPGQTDAVLVIADPAPNSESYSWTIPATVAPGTYIIRVRSKSNSQATDDSAQFEIQQAGGSASTGPKRLKRSVPIGMDPKMKIKIDVTEPPAERQYTLGDTINVVFKTELPGPFVLDLMREDGTTLFRSFGEYQGTSTGPGTQLVQVLSGMFPEPRIQTGWYRIRVRRAQGLGSGVSNRIHVARPTKEIVVQLQPVVRDRHSRRRIDTEYDWQIDEGFERSRPGLARAGSDFRYFLNPNAWVGFIFRTQVTFPVETVSLAGRTLKEAWIVIEEKLQLDGYVGTQNVTAVLGRRPVYFANARGWKVFALTGPWDGDCIDTPGYQIGEIPKDADSCNVHLDDLAREWLAGTKPNHGLIIGSRYEPFDAWQWWCFFAISWYKVTLNLKFVEEI